MDTSIATTTFEDTQDKDHTFEAPLLRSRHETGPKCPPHFQSNGTYSVVLPPLCVPRRQLDCALSQLMQGNMQSSPGVDLGSMGTGYRKACDGFDSAPPMQRVSIAPPPPPLAPTPTGWRRHLPGIRTAIQRMAVISWASSKLLAPACGGLHEPKDATSLLKGQKWTDRRRRATRTAWHQHHP